MSSIRTCSGSFLQLSVTVKTVRQCDAKLTVSSVSAAPVRQSGHVRPRVHAVQRRPAVWLQVSVAFRDHTVEADQYWLSGTDDESHTGFASKSEHLCCYLLLAV